MRSFELKTEFIEVNGELFEVLRKIKEDQQPVVETWKEHLMADKVFRRDGLLYFCRSIEEAIVLEWIDTKNTSTDNG